MKYLIIALSLFLVVLTGCNKDKRDCSLPKLKAPAAEVATLKKYLDDNSITAIFDTSGFYYNIAEAGGAQKPDLCSIIQIGYKGTLTNGTVFDSQSSYAFYLSNLIYGWQLGVPKVGKGGRVTLYLPPSLAYGSNATGTIPANSILIFDISLQDFTN